MASFKILLFAMVCINIAIAKPKSFKIQPRIIGDSDAPPNAYPYMIGIFAGSNYFVSIVYGAATISERHKLSAADAVKY